MKKEELKPIVSWIINRKCKRDDSIHVKRAVKETKAIAGLTKWNKEEIIDMVVNNLIKNNWKHIEPIELPFAYVSKLIYDVSLPALFEEFTQDHIKKFM